MKTRKMRTLAWSAAALTLAIALSACSGDNDSDSTLSASSSPSVTAPASPSGSPSASPDATASASPSGTSMKQEASGEFVGMIDNHSIEIKIDGTAKAFQVDPETLEKVSDWDEGTKVKIQYIDNTVDVDGEKVIQSSITAIDKE